MYIEKLKENSNFYTLRIPKVKCGYSQTIIYNTPPWIFTIYWYALQAASLKTLQENPVGQNHGEGKKSTARTPPHQNITKDLLIDTFQFDKKISQMLQLEMPP